MVSGVETVGRVREKEREIFAFATGLVSVEILHPNQFLPFDVCYAGVIYSTLAAKITNRDIMSFGAV